MWPARLCTRFTLVALEPLHDCPSVNEVTWKDMSKINVYQTTTILGLYGTIVIISPITEID